MTDMNGLIGSIAELEAVVGKTPPAVNLKVIEPVKIFASHVGLGAKIAGALLSVPGLMQKSLEKDYKSNPY